MRKVCIIYTGGTIGMTETQNGYAPKKGYLREKLTKIEDLYDERMPLWDLIEMSPLLDSSNIAVNEWNRIAREVEKRYNDYDGFVILHGTDTMAYTASALSFMFQNLSKPVILTGSQIPLSALRSDGRDNLSTSILIAAEGRVREVALYFGGRLMRGNRCTKYSADGLLAFRSPNYPLLAEAGTQMKYNDSAIVEHSKGEFSVKSLSSVPIGVIKVFPGIQFEIFEPIMTGKLRGIVLETFGAGNIPHEGNELLPIIKKAFANGTVITVCSQCFEGSVSLGEYETSSGLKSAGAVSGYDLTTEAAVVKLYYLFSCGHDSAEVKRLMEENLRGEITER